MYENVLHGSVVMFVKKICIKLIHLTLSILKYQ
jgi:hypothetical protein